MKDFYIKDQLGFFFFKAFGGQEICKPINFTKKKYSQNGKREKKGGGKERTIYTNWNFHVNND